MARVKICPNCRRENTSRAPFCAECGVDLSGVEITESRDATGGPVPGQVEHATTGRRPATGTWREEPCGTKAFLVFPWGDEEIDDFLFIGRDPVSRVAERIEQEGFGWVSRRHAEVYLEDGMLYVRDVGSTNGTFVNGTQVETQPVALADGDQVAFSRHLVATVRRS